MDGTIFILAIAVFTAGYFFWKYVFNRLANKKILYNTLIENIDDSVFVKNKKLEYLQVNKAFRDTYQVVENTRFDDKEIFDDETCKIYRELDEQILKSGIPVKNREIYEGFRYGGGRWVLVNRFPVRWGSKIVGVTGINKDISGTKKIEHKLEKSLEFSQKIMDSIPIPMFYKDEHLRYKGVNKEFCRFVNKTSEEILNKNAFSIIDSEMAKKIDIHDKIAFQKDKVNFELHIVTEEGEDKYLIDYKSAVSTDSGDVVIGVLFDITDQRLKEKQIENNFKFIHNIIDAVPVPIYYKDEELNFTGCNKEFLKYLGKTEEEILGKKSEEIFGSLKCESHTKMDNTLLKNGGIQVYEAKTRYDGNEDRDVVYYKHVFEDPNTGKSGIVGSIIDISDLKKVEKALKESESHLRDIYENIPIGLYRAKPNGEFDLVNPALFKILGFDEKLGFTGISFTDGGYVDENARSRFFSEMKREGKIQGFENQWKRKDGSIIWIREAATAHKDSDGNLLFYEGTVEDITEQNQMMEFLHESENKYRSLIENTADAIFMMEAYTLKAFNRKFAELFDLDTFAVNEVNLLELNVENPSLLILLNKIRDFMLIDSNNTQVEFKIENTLQDEFYLDAHLTRLEKNTVQGVIRDVSDKHKLENRIRQMQKMEAVGTLAAGIAHEINTPTQFINDNLHFLADSFSNIVAILSQIEFNDNNETMVKLTNLPMSIDADEISFLTEEIPMSLEQSIDGTRRIRKIVSAMKEFAHAGSKERIASDIHKLILNTITVSKNEWKYVADIETDFDESLPDLVCDPDQLNQVFLNLIINAAHAIEERQRTTEGKGKITIITYESENNFVIKVSDTGCGIPEHIHDRIFDPFFTTKEVGKGSGQGLSIVYSIVVEQHNGNIDFTTRPGEGTDFFIQLPISEQNQDQ